MIDLKSTQKHLQRLGLSGWLLYDFEEMNPILWEVLGFKVHITRPCILFIPVSGATTLLVHKVDAGRFGGVLVNNIVSYLSRIDMQRMLGNMLQVGQHLAMEYSPLGELPVISRVDAGTIEFIRSLGVEIVSSADLIQLTIARLNEQQMALQASAARKLTDVVNKAFEFIGQRLLAGVTELDVCHFIQQAFVQNDLYFESGPVVAVNEHSGDPHYEPSGATNRQIQPGDWVLIDLWAKDQHEDAVFADITWVGFVGQNIPPKHQQVFETVVKARDIALRFVRESFEQGETIQGWQVDEQARSYIASQGYGPYFTHRLGHSLGKTVHSYAVNLDNFETHDTRSILPGIAFTIEPGIYLAEFGARSEINVVITERGPVVTTPVQENIVPIIPPC